MAPPPPASAVINWGGSAGGTALWVVLSLRNFAPNTTYSVQCHDNWGNVWGPTAPAYTVTTNGSGSFDGQWCYFGYYGYQIKLQVWGNGIDLWTNTLIR